MAPSNGGSRVLAEPEAGMSGPKGSMRLSVVIVTYNGMDTLPGTLENLRNYPLPIEETIVVDDGSTDGSVEWLRTHAPAVRVIAFPANTGNVALVRNAGLEAASGTHVFLTDNDVELLPGCLERLLAVLQADERVFCVTPRLMYHDRPDVVFQDGNGMHCLALGTGNHRGIPVEQAGVPAPFPTCGGGLMLFDRAKLCQVGGFDAGYMHAWADDAELQLRGILYGFKCLHVPAAAATHHAKDHGTQRARGQIYNRFRVLTTFYRTRTLLLMLPSLLVFESALIAAGTMHGFGGMYFAALRQAWRDRRSALASRRELQQRRRAPDSEVFRSGPFEIPGVVAPGPVVRRCVAILQTLFDANWRLVRWVEQ
jgi:GT2 family glycosyltransferase